MRDTSLRTLGLWLNYWNNIKIGDKGPIASVANLEKAFSMFNYNYKTK